METTVWEGIAAAFGLMVMTSIFWVPALIIGLLWRSRRQERRADTIMRTRLDLAIEEQRLQNMRREQLLEDAIYHQRLANAGVEVDGGRTIESDDIEQTPNRTPPKRAIFKARRDKGLLTRKQ